MAYVLEKITSENVEKILADLESDQAKKRRAIGDGLFAGSGVLNWAVERESNSYIFHAPTTREQAINPRFYFFYQNEWYELWVNDLFGNVIHFDSPEPTSEATRQKFRSQLKDALLVFGRYGTGSTDFSDSIVAEFKEGA